jgi:hypothetical protein
MHAREELLGHARDRDVVHVKPLVADEREQEVERPRERRQVDDERLAAAGAAGCAGAITRTGSGAGTARSRA